MPPSAGEEMEEESPSRAGSVPGSGISGPLFPTLLLFITFGK